MDREELERRLEELNGILKEMRTAFFDAVNGSKPMSELELIIKKLEEKRQLLNNQDIGLFLSIDKFSITTFKLFGDSARDMGQINKSKQSG